MAKKVAPTIQGEAIEMENEGTSGSNITRQPKMTSIIVLFFGAFLAMADDAFLIVSYESIASHFNRLSDGSFLLISYTFGYSIALPVYGSLSDIFRCKPTLLLAYILFAAGCLVSSVANSLWLVMAGRVISGIGGAGVLDLVSVLIIRLFDITQVASVRGYLMAVTIAGRGMGGPIGGLLTDTIGWRWAFAIQVPLILICLVVATIQLPSETPQYHLPDEKPSFRHVDYLGIGLFASFISTFILALEFGKDRYGWKSPIVISLAVACCIFLVAFILIEKHTKRRPMISPKLISTPGVKSAYLIQILSYIAWSNFSTNLVPFFSRTEGLSYTESALRIWGTAAGFAIGSVLAGLLIKKIRRYKNLSTVATCTIIIMYVLITVRWRNGTNPWECMYIFPLGLGYGSMLAAQFISVTLCAPSSDGGMGIGLYYLSQQIGIMIGIVTSATFIQTMFRQALEHGLNEHYSGTEKQQVIMNILKDIKFTKTLPQLVQEVVRLSYLHGFRWIPVFAIFYTAVALPLFVIHRERSMEQDQE